MIYNYCVKVMKMYNVVYCYQKVWEISISQTYLDMFYEPY